MLIGIALVRYEELLANIIGLLACEETVVRMWVIKIPPAEVGFLVFFLGIAAFHSQIRHLFLFFISLSFGFQPRYLFIF